jgi:hypothetical protein
MYRGYNVDQYGRKFAEEIAGMESKGEAKVLGGDCYPKNSTMLLISCNGR